MSSPASETKDSVEIELLKRESKAKFAHEVLRHPCYTCRNDIDILDDDFSASLPYYFKYFGTSADAFVFCQPYLVQIKTNGFSEWVCGELQTPFRVTDQGFTDIDKEAAKKGAAVFASLEELIKECSKPALKVDPHPYSLQRYLAIKSSEIIKTKRTIREFQENCDLLDKITETWPMYHRSQVSQNEFLPRFKSKEQETTQLPYDKFANYYGLAVDYIKCLEVQRPTS